MKHVTQSELDQYIEETWEIEENFAGLLPVKDGVTGNNPQLHNDTPTKDKQNTALDAWFHKQFPDDLKTLEEAQNMLKYLKKMVNQLESCVEGMKGYDNPYLETNNIEGTDLPSKGTVPNAVAEFNQVKDDSDDALQKRLESTSNSAGGLFDDIDFATLATNGRDNLYATMYIMNMFSYETSALEGLYELQGGGKDENDIYKRTADVIQLNMRENYPEFGEYKLEDAHTYFRLDANIRVKPLMLELPYAKMCGIEAPEDGAWNTLHSGAVRGY